MLAPEIDALQYAGSVVLATIIRQANHYVFEPTLRNAGVCPTPHSLRQRPYHLRPGFSVRYNQHAPHGFLRIDNPNPKMALKSQPLVQRKRRR